MTRIKIYIKEMIHCPIEGIIIFDSECLECKHHQGYYSAINELECSYK